MWLGDSVRPQVERCSRKHIALEVSAESTVVQTYCVKGMTIVVVDVQSVDLQARCMVLALNHCFPVEPLT